jgi:hypothetical protein
MAPRGRVTDVAAWGTVTANGFQPTLDLTCPAAGTCYADADGQIEYTHDGGATWQQGSGFSTTTMATDISMATDIHCVDADHCSLMGQSSDGGSVLFSTADGGASWTSQPGPRRSRWSGSLPDCGAGRPPPAWWRGSKARPP